ncbi:MAG: response regulator, partial [Nitrososphaerales archaeon]
DGFAVLRQLRQNPSYATLPVVALTAYAMQGDREKVLAAGFDAYLTKPVDVTALRAQIQQLLT